MHYEPKAQTLVPETHSELNEAAYPTRTAAQP
jgi:hypothetical protein